MAATNNLSCFRGEAVTQPIVHIDEDTETRVDITGWTIMFTLRQRPKTQDYILQKQLDITDGINGEYELVLDADETLLDANAYHYDIWRTDTGFEAVLSKGIFRFYEEALRA